jgi:hypothetical protein
VFLVLFSTKLISLLLHHLLVIVVLFVSLRGRV